jgi:hypothetical protein
MRASPPFAAIAMVLLGLAGGAAYAALSPSAGPRLPRPKITSSPSALTNQTSASFTFSSKVAVTFLCSLDGGPSAPCGSGVAGSDAYAGPLADGLHSFELEAQSAGLTSRPRTRTWTVDTLPPPLPDFSETPPDSTTETKARFVYTDAEPHVVFTCELDGGSYAPCDSNVGYNDLSEGSHTFCVRAHDAAGNAGSAACSTWLIGSGAVGFSISGSPPAGSLLYPGGRPVPLNLVFTNPNASPITVDTVTVSVTGTSAPGCDPSGFTVAQQLAATPTVPADSTLSLQDLGVAQSDWPQLEMIDAGDQDACQNATVSLAYSGSASG